MRIAGHRLCVYLNRVLSREGTPDHCLVASVVRGADEMIHKAVQTVWGLMPQVFDTEMDLGIDVAVPRPDHVGIDRLLQASEAFRVCGESVVVAAFGSALTVDLVTADGVFRGGTIAPGLGMGLRALHDETSLLPHVALQPPDSAVGRDTASCIQAGVIYGAAGAVERLFGELAPDGQCDARFDRGRCRVDCAFHKLSLIGWSQTWSCVRWFG